MLCNKINFFKEGDKECENVRTATLHSGDLSRKERESKGKTTKTWGSKSTMNGPCNTNMTCWLILAIMSVKF